MPRLFEECDNPSRAPIRCNRKDFKLRVSAIFFLGILLASCNSSKPAEPAQTARNKPAAFSTDAVAQDLRDGGVQVQASREQAQAFFRAHPSYHVCRDSDTGLVAVLRKTPGESGPDDQYIALGYRSGKVTSLDVGPPQFSADNVSACQ